MNFDLEFSWFECQRNRSQSQKAKLHHFKRNSLKECKIRKEIENALWWSLSHSMTRVSYIVMHYFLLLLLHKHTRTIISFSTSAFILIAYCIYITIPALVRCPCVRCLVSCVAFKLPKNLLRFVSNTTSNFGQCLSCILANAHSE